MPAFRIDANAANASGTLGVCNIENPIYDDRNADNNPYPSEYNRVYFGWVPETTTGKAINNTDSNNSTSSVDPYSNSDGSIDIHNTPLYWRVLNTTANDDTSTPALFMLTEYSLPTTISWDFRNSEYNQNWYFTENDTQKTDSSLRKFLQGTSCSTAYTGDTEAYSGLGLYDECFAPEEQNVILTTTKTETDNLDTINWRNLNNTIYMGNKCNLDNDTIFLLSASEVTDNRYGFEGSRELNFSYNTSDLRQARDTNRGTKSITSSRNSNWWLRSAYSSTSNLVTRIIHPGYSSINPSISTDNAVRFALNLPLSSVLFASDASTEGASPSSTFTTIPTSLTRTKFKYGTSNSSSPTMTEAAKIYKVENSTDVEYSSGDTPDGAKLTIVDNITDRRLFWIPQGKYSWPKGTVAEGTYIMISYRLAMTGENEYISAIIKDQKDEHNYYARLKALPNLGDSNGIVNMTIPGDIPNGVYTLIMMNEKDNGPYKTNYAKNYDLRMTVDSENITISSNDAAGACTIMDPEYDNNGSTYNRVYFGRTPTDNNTTSVYNTNIYHDNAIDKPIYWRVLNTHANDKSSTPALFMLNEYILTNDILWDNTDPYGQSWTDDSTIRNLLNGIDTGSIYNKCFQPKEQNAIMKTYNGEIMATDKIEWVKNISTYYYAYGCGLTGEKLFLLSAKEVTNKAYGFSNKTSDNYHPNEWPDSNWYAIYPNDINKTVKRIAFYGGNNIWWLRSAFSTGNDRVANVSSSGYSGGDQSYYSYMTVRFALNIPLSQILFTQDASSAGATPSIEPTSIPSFNPLASSELTRTIITYPTSGYAKVSTENSSSTDITTATTAPGAKLTIVDDDRYDFAIAEDIMLGDKGQCISIHYSGAKTDETTANNMGYISAIIKDTSGNALYHKRLRQVGTNASGSLSILIPQDIDYDDYTLVVYNEVERGAYNTNYAGYDTLMLSVVDATNPNITNAYKNITGNKFKLTTSDKSLSHISTILGDKIMDLYGTLSTKNLQLADNIDGIMVYDTMGNATTMESENIIIDKTPPKVTMTYSNGKYTLTVSDNESGVWKITDKNGVVYQDFS